MSEACSINEPGLLMLVDVGGSTLAGNHLQIFIQCTVIRVGGRLRVVFYNLLIIRRRHIIRMDWKTVIHNNNIL